MQIMEINKISQLRLLIINYVKIIIKSEYDAINLQYESETAPTSDTVIL